MSKESADRNFNIITLCLNLVMSIVNLFKRK